VIRANTETLLAGAIDDPVRGRQFTQALLRHAERLGRLVSDLLDISRIEAGQYRLELRPVTMAQAVVRVFESVEVEAAEKNIDVGVDIEPDLELVADEKALDQILINLVGNAVKYTPSGGHVEVAAFRVGERVRIEVRDDGPGIDPRHRNRVFERFYRVDPGRSRDMGGTGLGLSIVKHLVDAMHGQLGLEARSPHGSVFWFSLAGSNGVV
jgi:two-component system phosphate regulon sensor histidine kinase PhoR